MLDFSSGAVAMGYFVAGLFFLKFWARTRDELFAAFAAAFGLLALEQLLLVWSGLPREEQTWFYLMRLVAFLLIIGAILRKNRRRA
jgi:peptidoglycan/LPS O-acetylase OafA/YrhL